MIFTSEQIKEILNIIDYHHLFTFSVNFGVDVLTEEDRSVLSLFGVNLSDLSKEPSMYDKMYHLGKLSGILGDKNTKKLEYSDFLKYMLRGQYVPLTQRERFELDIARRKTYVHLKGLKDRVKAHVEGSVLDQEQKLREAYEKAVSEETSKGVVERKAVSAVVSDLGHRLGTFEHDWGRIVETEMNNIFQLGRAAEIGNKYGSDASVYKSVFPGACRHCIEKYLTNGIGSKPRVFKLKEITSNGTNIGKKVAEWKATLQSLHPYCRCLLRVVLPGYVWNEEKGIFDVPKNFVRKVERRSVIMLQVGDKYFEV